MMYPNPDEVPRVPIAKATVRDSQFVDVELRDVDAEAFQRLGVRQGDLLELSHGPLEPDGVQLVVEQVTRPAPTRVAPKPGVVVVTRPVGPAYEECRLLARGFSTGSKFTIVGSARIGEFTVHRNITVEGIGALKLHFAHGSQMVKLQFAKGTTIRIKERPCGVEEWTVLDMHTENLDRCPNCSGAKGKEFNSANLCQPGTQWALVHPAQASPQGLALYAEKSAPPRGASSLTEPSFLRWVARPDPRVAGGPR